MKSSLKLRVLLATMPYFMFLGLAEAQVTHHNIDVTSCRVLLNGALQIIGKSDLDNTNYRFNYGPPLANETVVDRYFSLCMAALTTEKNLRLDYVVCSGVNCTPQGTSSIQLLK